MIITITRVGASKIAVLPVINGVDLEIGTLSISNTLYNLSDVPSLVDARAAWPNPVVRNIAAVIAPFSLKPGIKLIRRNSAGTDVLVSSEIKAARIGIGVAMQGATAIGNLDCTPFFTIPMASGKTVDPSVPDLSSYDIIRYRTGLTTSSKYGFPDSVLSTTPVGNKPSLVVSNNRGSSADYPYYQITDIVSNGALAFSNVGAFDIISQKTTPNFTSAAQSIIAAGVVTALTCASCVSTSVQISVDDSLFDNYSTNALNDTYLYIPFLAIAAWTGKLVSGLGWSLNSTGCTISSPVIPANGLMGGACAAVIIPFSYLVKNNYNLADLAPLLNPATFTTGLNASAAPLTLAQITYGGALSVQVGGALSSPTVSPNSVTAPVPNFV